MGHSHGSNVRSLLQGQSIGGYSEEGAGTGQRGRSGGRDTRPKDSKKKRAGNGSGSGSGGKHRNKKGGPDDEDDRTDNFDKV